MLRSRSWRRAFARGMAGFEKDNILAHYQFVTFTTPENFQGGVNRAWRLFRLRLARRGINFPYFAVQERNKANTCTHIHAIVRSEWIPYDICREQWKAVTGAVWIHSDRLSANYLGKDGYWHEGSAAACVYYVLKYMGKNPTGQRAVWYSADWICRGYASIGRDLARLEGIYPDVARITEFSEMEAEEREKQIITLLADYAAQRVDLRTGEVRPEVERVRLYSSGAYQGSWLIGIDGKAIRQNLHIQRAHENFDMKVTKAKRAEAQRQRSWLDWWHKKFGGDYERRENDGKTGESREGHLNLRYAFNSSVLVRDNGSDFWDCYPDRRGALDLLSTEPADLRRD